ncbi:hypothetical protein Ccrd_004683 [Cynara cardunculus var. scolymus]|uniref:Uncharacterized protein n=1 Tax=Cynara cardunculus var. scolymus TaxID=59895 RepID=A0A103XM28_CYNCS|nr:hypothetical protein Ccrd_004683 [Cynara cardunculus var. scolymus]
MVKFDSDGKLQMLSNTFPVNKLKEMSNSWTIFNLSKLLGRGPTIMLLLTSKSVMPCSIPTSSGRQPARRLLDKRPCSKYGMCPKLLGMHPLNLLLDKTSMEAGEFPMFSGRREWKRLLFTTMASSSLSKSSGGNAPSNSLYLISRNFKEGIPKITLGKGPTKRLSLASSSNKSIRFEKLLGKIP